MVLDHHQLAWLINMENLDCIYCCYGIRANSYAREVIANSG